MSALIDSSLLVAYHNTKDRNQAMAQHILGEIADGEHGLCVTTDFIVSEAIAAALAATKRRQVALELGAWLFEESEEPFLRVEEVTRDDFVTAWGLFKRYKDKSLSFVDCTSIAVVRSLGLDKIISFDRDFDGLVPRYPDAAKLRRVKWANEVRPRHV